MNRLLVSALFLLPTAALALSTDREQEMRIAADNTQATLTADGTAKLSGNVKIAQGSLQIGAEQADIFRQAGQANRALLKGSPATVEQALDSGGKMKARATQIDYDIAGNVLVLTGSVIITQPEGELRGERVRYDINSGKIEGGQTGSRIEMVIPGKPKQPAAN